MKKRSDTIIDYMIAKISFDAMNENIEPNKTFIDDLEYLKKSIGEEVYSGIFDEAFPGTPQGFIPLGVVTGTNILIPYVAERFL